MSESSSYSIEHFQPTSQSGRQLIDFQHRIANSDTFAQHVQTTSLLNSLLRNKFQQRQQHFIAIDQRQDWISHVVARISPTLCDTDNSPIGTLGFFVSLNHPQAAGQVLRKAHDWLVSQGCQTIIGPIDGDTWHNYRLNTGPYDAAPFLGEPNHPAYYVGLWKSAGFQVIDRYHSRTIDDIRLVLPTTQPVYESVIQQGYQFRHFDTARFDQELDIIYELSTALFQYNFLYDEISCEDFKALYEPARRLIDPKLIWFALDATGKEIGFLFCMIDYGPAIAAMKGQTGWWPSLTFAWRSRFAKAVNFKSIGVIPEHRRSAVATALMHQGYVHALARRFRRANLCLIRDGNPSSKLDGGQSQILRRYELYQASEKT